MFHKLLKYEFTAVGRELLPVYLMMIAAAILANIFMPIKAVISSAFAFFYELVGKLAYRSGFAHAVHADDQHDARLRR